MSRPKKCNPRASAAATAAPPAKAPEAAFSVAVDLTNAECVTVPGLVDPAARPLNRNRSIEARPRDDLSGEVVRVTGEHLAAGFPPVEYVWEGRIPVGKVTVLAGPGGVGKSTVVAGLAVSRAIGTLPAAALGNQVPKFLGARVEPGPTVFVVLEDSAEDYFRRARAYIPGPGFHDAVASNVTVLDLTSRGYRIVVPAGRDYQVDEGAVDSIAQQIPRGRHPCLVVLETASLFGGDESNAANAMLIAACARLARVTGAAIVLIAHVSKAQAKEGPSGNQHAARGGAAITDNSRSGLLLSFDPRRPDRIVLQCVKHNDGPRPPDIDLVRVVNERGVILKRRIGRHVEDEAQIQQEAEEETRRKTVALARLYDFVEARLPVGPVSPWKLCASEEVRGKLAMSKHGIEDLVGDAVAAGILVANKRDARGRIHALGLGVRPVSGVPGDVEPGSSFSTPERVEKNSSPAFLPREKDRGMSSSPPDLSFSGEDAKPPGDYRGTPGDAGDPVPSEVTP